MALHRIVFGTLLACGLSSAADDPLNGTWKIDTPKSWWSNGKFPKNMSITITLHVKGDQMVYHSINDTNPERKTGVDYTATMDGKPYSLKGSDRYNMVSVRRLGKTELDILETKDGDDVIVSAIWEILPGGKRFVRRGIAKGADGKSYEYEEFFDKQ